MSAVATMLESQTIRSDAAPTHSSTGRLFEEPPWAAPLDTPAMLASIPKEAQIAGMFFLALIARSTQLNVVLPSLRDRYVGFQFYPQSELAQCLLEAAPRFYPQLRLREALRIMGQAAPRAVVASTMGKVIFGSAEGVHAAVQAMTGMYQLNMRIGRGEVLETAERWMVVGLHDVNYLLDSHHVGVYEGVMIHSGVKGRVSIATKNRSSAELLLQWGE
jgi:uncharacterized protein (TIGR02265 family)